MLFITFSNEDSEQQGFDNDKVHYFDIYVAKFNCPL